eukprot:scaffold18606_cov104-Isochrysis_galbana.AAC.2
MGEQEVGEQRCERVREKRCEGRGCEAERERARVRERRERQGREGHGRGRQGRESRRGHAPVVPRAGGGGVSAQLLQVSVPHAVELVAKGPDDERRLVSVLRHLPLELADQIVPLARGADGALGRIAHVERSHRLEAVGVHRVEEVGVVVLGQPAVHPQHVRAHRLDQRQVALPDEGVVGREVVAVRHKVDRLVHRGRAVADAAHLEGLAIEQHLPTLHLH